jgi:hypothetical protein
MEIEMDIRKINALLAARKLLKTPKKDDDVYESLLDIDLNNIAPSTSTTEVGDDVEEALPKNKTKAKEDEDKKPEGAPPHGYASWEEFNRVHPRGAGGKFGSGGGSSSAAATPAASKIKPKGPGDDQSGGPAETITSTMKHLGKVDGVDVYADERRHGEGLTLHIGPDKAFQPHWNYKSARNSDDDVKTASALDAQRASKILESSIKSRLKDPSSAKWGKVEKNHNMVAYTVTAKNSFGAFVTTRHSLVRVKNGHWVQGQ